MTHNSTNEQISEELEKINENKFYLSLLPKIKPKDYQGTDLCTKCYKTVAKNHQAVSCDTCERWTHRSCSYIDIKKYRSLKKYSSFPWLCKNCKPFLKNQGSVCEIYLDANEMPQSFEYFKKQSNCFNKNDQTYSICCS